MNPDDI